MDTIDENFSAEDHIKPSSKFNCKGVFVVLSIVMALLYAREWKIRHSYENHKNFYTKWNLATTKVSCYLIESDHKLSDATDSNFDLNFEKSKDYFPNGKLSCEYRDQDENGFYETATYYDLDGNITSIESDSNGDFIIDLIKINLEDGNTLTLVDSNGNGQFGLK